MIHQILPDGMVAVHGKGDLELGAHAVHAGDEHRLLVLAGLEREQTAEAAHLAQHLGPRGGLE